MPHPLRFRRRLRCAGAAAALLAALAAPAAGAGPVATLALEPESALVPALGDPVPLTGTIVVELQALPDGEPVGLALQALSLAADGLAVTLDDALAAPGLGVLYADGRFLVPTLFVRVDDGGGALELALPDVEGTLDTGDPALFVLEADVELDTPEGLVTAVLVAAPEPDGAGLPGAAAAALAALSRRAAPRGRGSSGRAADGRAGRAGSRGSDR